MKETEKWVGKPRISKENLEDFKVVFSHYILHPFYFCHSFQISALKAIFFLLFCANFYVVPSIGYMPHIFRPFFFHYFLIHLAILLINLIICFVFPFIQFYLDLSLYSSVMSLSCCLILSSKVKANYFPSVWWALKGPRLLLNIYIWLLTAIWWQ